MSKSFHGACMSVVPTNEKRLQSYALSVVMSLLILQCAQASAQEWSWTFEKVARGVTSSIALDPDQNLHLSYLTREGVYYAFRPPGSLKWFSTKLVNTSSITNVWPRVV